MPEYARKCFLFIDGKLTRLPTEPWAGLKPGEKKEIKGKLYVVPDEKALVARFEKDFGKEKN